MESCSDPGTRPGQINWLKASFKTDSLEGGVGGGWRVTDLASGSGEIDGWGIKGGALRVGHVFSLYSHYSNPQGPYYQFQWTLNRRIYSPSSTTSS